MENYIIGVIAGIGCYWLTGCILRFNRMHKFFTEHDRHVQRIAAARKLHEDVFREYGPEAYLRLPDIDTIVKDNKSINVINYLDI